MKPETKSFLEEKLDKIEKVANTSRIKNGYTKDTKKLMILVELIKEQIPYAHTDSTTRSLR